MRQVFHAWCAGLALALAAGPAAADEWLTARALDFEAACCTNSHGWRQVERATLGAMRGGFTTPSGLQLSLGIERMVSINGELVSYTNFQIADLNNISGAEALRARAAMESMSLVQNGDNNLAAVRSGTFIQNSLNDQAIRSQTIISSSVNSMSMLKDINFQGGIRDAVINALSTR